MTRRKPARKSTDSPAIAPSASLIDWKLREPYFMTPTGAMQIVTLHTKGCAIIVRYKEVALAHFALYADTAPAVYVLESAAALIEFYDNMSRIGAEYVEVDDDEIQKAVDLAAAIAKAYEDWQITRMK